MDIVKIAIYHFLNLLQVLIFIRCILSWVRISGSGTAGNLIRLLYALTDPIILPIRTLIDKSPLGGGRNSGVMIDFSPIIAWLIIGGVNRILMAIL